MSETCSGDRCTPPPTIAPRNASSRTSAWSHSACVVFVTLEPSPSGDDASVPKLDINSGESIAMDAMGPVVVNDDGSLSRIANWPMLTDREKEVTQRRIAKRNNERLDRLRQAAKENDH